MNFAAQFFNDKLKAVQDVLSEKLSSANLISSTPAPAPEPAPALARVGSARLRATKPSRASSNSSDVDFSQYEVDLLQATFAKLGKEQDKIALEIFEEVTKVEAIASRIPETTKYRIGIIVVSCMERCLHVANYPDQLNDVIAEVKERCKKQGISPRTLTACLLRSKDIFKQHMIQHHECSENDTNVIAANISALREQMASGGSQQAPNFLSYCEICSTWNRFFDYTMKVIDSKRQSISDSSSDSHSRTPSLKIKRDTGDEAADSQVEFTEYEMKLLNSSFQKLMKNQDQVAWELRKEITANRELSSKIKESSGEVQIGFILLTIVDQFLKVLNNSARLLEVATEMNNLGKRHGMSRKNLLVIMQAGMPVIKDKLLQCHKCSENDPSLIAKSIKSKKGQMAKDGESNAPSFLTLCETCSTWSRCFDIISKQLEAAAKENKNSKKEHPKEQSGSSFGEDFLSRVGSTFGSRKAKSSRDCEIDFAEHEILILRTSSENLSKDLDKVAVKILEEISANDDIISKIPEHSKLRIGVIIISCVERCLEAASNPVQLNEAIAEVKERTKKQGISSKTLVAAMKLSKPVIKRQLVMYHKCPENDPSLIAANISSLKDQMARGSDEPAPCFLSYCETCSTWNRFYDYTIKMLRG